MSKLFELNLDGEDSGKFSLFEEVNNDGEILEKFLYDTSDTNHLFDMGSEKVDELIQISHVLEEMAESVGEIASDDGSSEAAMEAIKVCVDHLLGRAELKSKFRVAAENLRSPVNRVSTCKLATEDFMDHVRNIITKIVEWIKKAFTFVSSSISRAITSADGIAKRAKSIEQQSREAVVKSVAANATGITEQRLIKYFSSDGKTLGFSEIVNAYKEYIANIGGHFSLDFIKSVSSKIETIVSDIENNKTKEEILVDTDNLITSIKNDLLGKFSEDTKTSAAVEGHEVLIYKLPFDEKSISVIISKETDKRSGLKIVINDSGKSSDSPGVLDVLSAPNVAELARMVEHEMTFGVFRRHNELSAEMNKAQKSIDKACNLILKKNIKSSKAESSDRTNLFSIEFLKTIFSSLVYIFMNLHKYDTRTAVYILDYCEKSLSKYE